MPLVKESPTWFVVGRQAMRLQATNRSPWLARILAGAALPLLILPVVAIMTGKLKELRIELTMSIWGVSTVFGVVLLFLALRLHLGSRGWIADGSRPSVGIAGKSWGLLAPKIFLPPTILFAIAMPIAGLMLTTHTALFLSALVVGLLLAGVAARVAVKLARNRAKLEIREANHDYQDLLSNAQSDVSSKCALEALQAISRFAGISADRLRRSDRFGYEIGTFSALDGTIDQISGVLLRRLGSLGLSTNLENIKTVGDFLDEWSRGP